MRHYISPKRYVVVCDICEDKLVLAVGGLGCVIALIIQVP